MSTIGETPPTDGGSQLNPVMHYACALEHLRHLHKFVEDNFGPDCENSQEITQMMEKVGDRLLDMIRGDAELDSPLEGDMDPAPPRIH